MRKNLFHKIMITVFAVSISLGTFNFQTQTAVAEPNDSSSSAKMNAINSIGIKPHTPTKVANSLLFLTKGQTLEFNLLDLYGNPINYGNYTDTVTITGPAYFVNGNQMSQKTELKIKNGQGKITFYVTNYYLPGEITVTSNFRTLLNKPFTENLYIPGLSGNATQVVLKDQPQMTIFSAEALFAKATEAFLTYNLQAEDAQDNPTATNAPTDLTTEVTYNGKPSTAVVATPTVSENGNYSVALKVKNEELQGASDIPVGDYTVTIIPKSVAKTTFAPLTETFTVTAD